MKRFALQAVALLTLILCGAVLVYGQSDRATITGRVSDPTGAVLPGAAVTVTSAETKAVFTTVTNNSGIYTVSSLPVGVYTLEVRDSGFKDYLRTGISPVAGQVITADVHMLVGAASETVTVNGASALDVDDASEAMTMEAPAIEELPLDAYGGRNALNLLVATAPNIQEASIASAGTQSWLAIAGGETFSNSMFIDGTNATSGYQGMAITPGQDALQEMQLQTNVTDAALAGTGGGAVVYVLKSGTNHFHGTAFEYLQNEDLNANQWIDNYWLSQCVAGDAACRADYSRPRDRFNDWGGSAGGPIWRNHTFIFGDYEYYKQTNMNMNPTGMTVPTAQLLSGDLSPLLTQGTYQGTIKNPTTGAPWINPCTGLAYQYGQVFDPATQKQVNGVTCATPFPGNIIPPGRLSAVSQKIAAVYNQYYKPTVNRLQGGNFPAFANDIYLNGKKAFDAKVDENFSDRHHLSGSLDYETDVQYGFGASFYTNQGPFGSLWHSGDPNNVMLRAVDNYTLRPTLINTFSVAWDYTAVKQAPVNSIKPSDYGFTTNVGVFPVLNFNATNGIGFTDPGSGWDAFSKNESYNYADTLAWQKGRHNLRFGIQYTALQMNAGNYTLGEQNYYFPSDTGGPTDPGLTPYVGSSLAAFLLGDVQSANLEQRRGYYPRQKTMALFTQDDFMVSPRLTLNLGLRWDLTLPGHMSTGQWENFDPNVVNPNWAPYGGAWVFSRNSGTTFESYTPLYQFGPHIGSAYEITNKLVARASYGLSYVPLGAFNASSADYFPGTQDPLSAGSNIVQTNVQGGTAFNWDNGYPGVTVTPPQNSTATSFGDTNRMMYLEPNMMKLGRVNTFYAGIEYGLARNVVLDTRYLGTFGVGLHDYGRGANFSWPANWSTYDAVLQSGNIYTTISSAADAASVSQAAGVTVPYPYPGFSGSAYAAISPFPQVAAPGYFVQYIGDPADNVGSRYNSFVAELKVRNTHGLYMDWSYTIGKETSNASSATWGALSNYGNIWGSAMQGPSDNGWWPIENDQRQLAKGYLTYDLPFGAHRRWLNQPSSILNYLVAGWTLGYYGAYGSGFPMGPVMSPYQLPYYYLGEQRAFFANGANADSMRNNFHRHFDPGNLTASGNKDFDQSSFQRNPNWYFSNNQFFGNTPLYFNKWRWNAVPAAENISIVKHFGVGKEDRYQVELRGEFYNAFNRHYFSAPDMNVNDSTFGYVYGTTGSSRVGQIAARFAF